LSVGLWLQREHSGSLTFTFVNVHRLGPAINPVWSTAWKCSKRFPSSYAVFCSVCHCEYLCHRRCHRRRLSSGNCSLLNGKYAVARAVSYYSELDWQHSTTKSARPRFYEVTAIVTVTTQRPIFRSLPTLRPWVEICEGKV
jgi:hypothetical protein